MRWIQSVVFLAVITYGEMDELDDEDMASASAIANYKGKRTEPIDIPKPGSTGLFTKKKGVLLIVGEGENETASLINTGNSVEVRLGASETDLYVTGETIGNYLYVYTRTIFYWAKSADGVAGTTIRGKEGTALEISIIYYNTKYKSYRKALEKRDGILQTRIRVNVNAEEDNKEFEPFGEKMKEIQTPGKIDVSMKDHNSWYLNFPNTPYYAYPGSLNNVTTKKTKDCSVTVVTRVVLNISRNQFDETFLNIYDDSTKNADEKYSTEQMARESNHRPIVHVTENGFVRLPSGLIDDGRGIHSEDGF